MQIFDLKDLFLFYVISIALLSILLTVVIIYAARLARKIKRIEKIRENDLLETNKLFIEKSENELNLFFQFETVLEELVKMMRKNNGQNIEIIENQKEIKLLIEYIVKK